MKPTLLLAEDDRILSKALCSQLGEKYRITACESVRDACDKIENQMFDLLVVDRILPDGDGIEIISYCREISPQTKIIACSQLTSHSDKVCGLSSGADDYLTKPYSRLEIELKLANYSRLSRLPKLQTYCFGPITLNDSTGQVVIDNVEETQLRKKESQILRFLIQHAPHTVSKDQIIENVWPDPDSQPSYATVDVYVRRIRMALKNKPYLLETIRGFGYKIRS